MTDSATVSASRSDLQCARCGQALDPTDKFCRECGLPTLRSAHSQRAVAVEAPPDTAELKRALDVVPEPHPFVRPDSGPLPHGGDSQELTTGSIVRVTSPTYVTRMAASTAVMVGLIAVLAGLGVLMLVLAFQP